MTGALVLHMEYCERFFKMPQALISKGLIMLPMTAWQFQLNTLAHR